jgi:hypothetical protein
MAHPQDFRRAAFQGDKLAIRVHGMHRTHEIALFRAVVALEKRIPGSELYDINARTDGHMPQRAFCGGAL